MAVFGIDATRGACGPPVARRALIRYFRLAHKQQEGMAVQEADTISWLERLVAIDTTSRNSNLGLIELVRDELRNLGLQPWLATDTDGGKANLFCTLPAADGTEEGGIVLSGHTDVVPVDGQPWDSDPFVLTDKGDGRLYGRGSCDMKGFLAAALAVVPHALQLRRRKALHLALSYDEEIGCVGAPVMLAELKKRGFVADGCIVGEPTSMKPVVAHKGMNVYKCTVRGKAAHSSLTTEGCNAIEYASRIIAHIRQRADEWRTVGPFDQVFDVPHNTIGTNLTAGGIAVNTIPEWSEFRYEFRNLPDVDPDEIQKNIEKYVADVILPGMRAEYPDAEVVFQRTAVVPGLVANEDSALMKLIQSLTGDDEIRKVAYGTEAGLFQELGIPSIICGPGSIEQAHKANEYVEADQLDQCDELLRGVVASLQ